MNVAICDDVSTERKQLNVALRRFEKEWNIDINCADFEDAQSLLLLIEKGVKFDVLFMDIYMQGKNGIEACRALRQNGFAGEIIFITTSKDHAIESYDVEAAGYICKPYEYSALSKALQRCMEKLKTSNKKVSFISRRLELSIFVKDILYIETLLRGCAVHAKNEVLTTQKSIGSFERELKEEPCFLKIGKSYLVNLNHTQKNDDNYIYFKNGEKIIMPVRDKQKIKKQIADYFWLLMKA